MNFILNTVIVGGEAAGNAVEGTTTAVSNSGGAMGLFSSLPGMLLYIGFIVLIFYFIAIRPQKKRDKQMASLQSEIKVGDWVLLDSGIYGKVTDISDQIFIIEFGTNKGVLIPVLKQRVVSKGEPNLTITKSN